MKKISSFEKRKVPKSQLNRAAKWRGAVKGEIADSLKEGIPHFGLDGRGAYVEKTATTTTQIMGRMVADVASQDVELKFSQERPGNLLAQAMHDVARSKRPRKGKTSKSVSSNRREAR